MIEFTSSQLSWILIGACSIGGTGYITIDNKMSDMDKKVAVIQTKAENTDKKLDSMAAQLTRVENMLINSKGPR